jgi:hypothetical protein
VRSNSGDVFRFQGEGEKIAGRRKTVLTGGSHMSARGREELRVPFRGAGKWAAGLLQTWAGMVSRGHFLFLFCFLLFLFLFSYFFNNFC